MKKAKIIAISNHKGGVGKTASVASIGAILASKGKKVLLVDLDTQANLTRHFFGGHSVPYNLPCNQGQEGSSRLSDS
jgi:ATPases involved in chromosome partitioning